ncbi:MAG: DUF6153 family protein [Nocardiopsaceae bacterium]|nr:DUF6153 family protein [Nocardiopsaceae bacterium]
MLLHRSPGRVLRSALSADIGLAVVVLVVGVALLAHHATMRPDTSGQSPGAVTDGHTVASTGHTGAADPVEPHSQAEDGEACDTPATTCLTAKTGIGVAVPAPRAIADVLIPAPMQAPIALASTSLPHPTPDLAKLSILRI